MIHLLPLLRWPWRRNTRPARPQFDAEPPVAVPAPVEPAWTHKPPEPFVWSEKCGWCRKHIPANSPDPEFCQTAHHALWLRETSGPTYGPELPPIQGCAPPPPGPDLRLVPDASPDPPWMAAIDAWERAKAERLMAERKAPDGKEEAA